MIRKHKDNTHYTKKPIPKKAKDILLKIFDAAMYNLAPHRAVKAFQKHEHIYQFDEDLYLKLGLIYDHIAQVYSNKNKKRDAMRLENKALKIYKNIFSKNPNSHKAVKYIGHIYRNRGLIDKAIKYHLKAYRFIEKLKIDKKKAGIMGIGLLYEIKGDKRRAEYWYKKDLENLGKNNFGANWNLLCFYIGAKQHKKAFRFALSTEKLLKKEPSMLRNSKWGRYVFHISKTIRAIKRID